MGLGILTLVTLWTPALLRLNGISAGNTAFVVAFNGLGAVVGHSSAGRLIQRFGILPVLLPGFLLGAAATFGLRGHVRRFGPNLCRPGWPLPGLRHRRGDRLGGDHVSDSDQIDGRGLGRGDGPFRPDCRPVDCRHPARRGLDRRPHHDRHRRRRVIAAVFVVLFGAWFARNAGGIGAAEPSAKAPQAA